MTRSRTGTAGAGRRPDSETGRVDEILDHSINLIKQHGLASLTMKKVAERIGFTETAAYRYFPNKHALLLGIADRMRGMLLDPMLEIARSDAPAPERLGRMLRHHVDFLAQTGAFPMLLLTEAAATNEEDVLARLREVITKYLEITTDLIKEMSPGPARPGIDERALLILGIPASLAVLSRIGVDPELEKRVRADLIPLVVRCLENDLRTEINEA